MKIFKLNNFCANFSLNVEAKANSGTVALALDPLAYSMVKTNCRQNKENREHDFCSRDHEVQQHGEQKLTICSIA